MDKKDIYEHLAKIYLDASSRKSKKSALRTKSFKNIIIVAVFFILGAGLALFFNLRKDKGFDSEVALVLCADPVKINFHFDPAKKEIFSLDLNKLNLINYKALGFSLKNATKKDSISLRVEFASAFKEHSEIYLEKIPYKWQDYKIDLSAFKNISDWSEMQVLAFIVEEWNSKEKNGIVYLDNVRLLK
ncbi:MAG: hypothetical protein AB1481_05080 [Candidatus Omnitrophota bacterium]